ncbi:chitinase [Chytriomyces confervae]|uniref:Chitinase n=1 Tax=Chytriomyces confervae TaxID=246404 RepID=A0A507EAD5_9FUNG|nr:chitinase [Chytriomyces confervae]
MPNQSFLVAGGTKDTSPCDTPTSTRPKRTSMWVWIALAAAGVTVLLLAKTNQHVSQVSPIVAPTDSRTVSNATLAAAFDYRPYVGPPGSVVYYTNWARYSRNKPEDLTLTGINVVNYAFYFVDSQGAVTSSDAWGDSLNLPALRAQRLKYPQLLTVAAIGGWTGSRYFSDMASTAETRAAFADNVLELLNANGFDGVDLDWEYPGGNNGLSCNSQRPNDADNFVLLLQQLRLKLGENRLISIAVSSSVTPYGLNLKAIEKEVSYMTVMTYDFNGPWSKFSDFNSALNADPKLIDPNPGQSSISSAMNAYVQAGVSKSKLVPGVSYYGRSWQVKTIGANNGLYQECGSSPNPLNGACVAIKGDKDDALEADKCTGATSYSGVWSWRNMRSQTNAPLLSQTTARTGWTRKYFRIFESATLRSGRTFISYDDPTSILAKSKWSKANGFGGVMVWEISLDYNNELTNAMLRGWAA